MYWTDRVSAHGLGRSFGNPTSRKLPQTLAFGSGSRHAGKDRRLRIDFQYHARPATTETMAAGDVAQRHQSIRASTAPVSREAAHLDQSRHQGAFEDQPSVRSADLTAGHRLMILTCPLSPRALNANFPPVFSNAPVDVDQRTRYWVTDGGAADNRVSKCSCTCARCVGCEPVDVAGRSADPRRRRPEPNQTHSARTRHRKRIRAGAQSRCIFRPKSSVNRQKPANVKLIYLRMQGFCVRQVRSERMDVADNILVNDPKASVCDSCMFASLQEWLRCEECPPEPRRSRCYERCMATSQPADSR